MGVSLTRYCGPVLMCEYGTYQPKTKVRMCTDSACREYREPVKYGFAHFCTVCGKLLEFIEINTGDEERTPSYSAVSSALHLSDADIDALMDVSSDEMTSLPKNTLVYLPNSYNDSPGRDMYSEDREDAFLDVSAIDFDAELAWFQEEYGTHIEVFKRLYASVRLTWAAISYWS